MFIYYSTWISGLLVASVGSSCLTVVIKLYWNSLVKITKTIWAFNKLINSGRIYLSTLRARYVHHWKHDWMAEGTLNVSTLTQYLLVESIDLPSYIGQASFFFLSQACAAFHLSSAVLGPNVLVPRSISGVKLSSLTIFASLPPWHTSMAPRLWVPTTESA